MYATHRKVCVISGTIVVANHLALFVSITAIQVLNGSPTLSDETIVANRVLMYVCMHVCMYVCMYVEEEGMRKVSISIHTHTYIHIYIHTY